MPLSSVAEEHLGVLTQVVVYAPDKAIRILREVASGIRVGIEVDLSENRSCRRYSGERYSQSRLIQGVCDGIRGATEGSIICLDTGGGKGKKLGRWDQCRLGGRASDSRPLGAGEEKQFVFLDWAAQHKSELVARIKALWLAVGNIVIRVRGIGGEAVELPTAAVNCICPRLRCEIDDSTRSASVLRGKVIGDDAVLLHRIYRDLLAYPVVKHGYVFHAIQQNLRARLALPIDCEAHAAGGQILTAGHVCRRVVSVADIAGEHHKVVGIAGQAGQLRQLPGVDHLRQFLSLGIHRDAALALHAYLGDIRPHRQIGVDCDMPTNRYLCRGGEGLEARRADSDLINGRREPG